MNFIRSALNGVVTSGKVFFVSAVTTGSIIDRIKAMIKPDPEGVLRFFTSIDSAIGSCVASRGDLIIVLPGHTETISSATGLVADVAGVKIVGIGEGSLVPILTFDTATTATIPVSAYNVSFENIIFSANFADIVSVFTLTTAKNFKLKNCKIKATASSMNFLYVVDTSTTNNDADGLTIDGCSWIEPDTATISAVKGDADIDSAVVKNSYFNLGVNTSDLPAIFGMATGKDLTNVVIENNDVIRLNDANPLLVVTDTTTANTGIIKNNRVRHADTAAELLVTAGTVIGYFDNKASAVNDGSGFLLPAADS